MKMAAFWSKGSHFNQTGGSKLTVAGLFKAAAMLLAAGILGNWFLSEVKQAKMKKKPWYTPYLSVPGLLILLALSLPVIAWLVQK